MSGHVNLNGLTPLEAAKLYDSPEFENKYAYRGKDLGAVYSPAGTTWKVWSPGAEAMSLKLYATGSDEEEGARMLGVYAMNLQDTGIWSVSIAGDCQNVYYTYEVRVAGQIRETADPYAKAAGVNGKRSMVVNLEKTNPVGWKEDSYSFRERAERAFIWEVHVKDFSSSEDSGMEYKGKYLAFTESGATLRGEGIRPTGVGYLKQLGVTHVQLLPVFDYATVDEREPERKYNWGYDPQNYNVPEGSYATDPYKGAVRIREFKQMVLALHQAGIGVIMDVVYNHTYETENSTFHRIMPYYYHRIWRDGSFANGSGCGNEIASERYMVRRYIVDSVLYWAKEYHIDGFRLDLMGLLDVQTINAIRRELNALTERKNILMYGEPWSALPPCLRPGCLPADRSTLPQWEKGIGYFNDEGRDGLKGSTFDVSRRGFITGAEGCQTAVVRMVQGLPEAERMIQYASCHDNYTLWDKITATVISDGSGYDAPEMIRIAVNKLAAAAVLCAKGIPFIQAGEEFGRTKYALANSYCSPVEVNQLQWSRLERFEELVRYYQGLAALRRRWIVPPEAGGQKLRVLAAEDRWIAWEMENKQWKVLFLFNSGHESRFIRTEGGKWQIVADERTAGVEILRETEEKELWVYPRSVLIAIQEHE